MKNPPLDALDCQITKEAFDHVQPRGTGRSEVEMKAGVSLLPGFDLLMLMRGVVIADEVDFLVGRRASANQVQEENPFLVAVLFQASANDLAIGNVQRGKKRGRSVSLVVMGEGLAAPLLQWKSRLRAIQGLDLALLIAGEHDGVLRRVEVESHDLFELLFKMRVVGKLEAACAMRLEAVCRPDPSHTRRADPGSSGH